MRHSIILAHPAPTSFNAEAARAFADALTRLGHDVEMRDLYAMDFDPRLKASELPWTPGAGPAPDVAAERAALSAAEVVTFVYPLWFNAPPAILKGYVERVFGLGFGYAAAEPGTRPLMSGKALVSITTSGAPNQWVDQTGAVERLRVTFDNHVAAVCGLQVLDHLHFGGVTPGIRPDAVEGMLDQVRAVAARLFQRSAGA
jgi:NAD(P)H dehydrogenase (quinone)